MTTNYSSLKKVKKIIFTVFLSFLIISTSKAGNGSLSVTILSEVFNNVTPNSKLTLHVTSSAVSCNDCDVFKPQLYFERYYTLSDNNGHTFSLPTQINITDEVGCSSNGNKNPSVTSFETTIPCTIPTGKYWLSMTINQTLFIGNTYTANATDIITMAPQTCSFQGCFTCSCTFTNIVEVNIINNATPLLANITSTFNACTESATVNASGGVSPYTYSWYNNQTTQTAVFSKAGTYRVTVSDAQGCNISKNTTTTFSFLTASATPLAGSCSKSANGSASVTPVGGASPYTYLWDDGETSATATKLTVGAHTVTVTDANACTATANVTISTNLSTLPSVTFTNLIRTTCAGHDGQATANESGGTAPYTYLWDNGETTITATKLTSGAHTVAVTDVNGCTAPSASVTIDIPRVDLSMKDVSTDDGTEPDLSTEPMWISDDIWVRNQDDGQTTHQDPIYDKVTPTVNYVYVRVRNNGCVPSLETEKLRVYWAKASTGLGWPTQWVNYSPAVYGCNPVKYGDELTSNQGVTINKVIPPGASAIVVIPWFPPNPDDFKCFVDNQHFCLLARIEASNDPMTYTETSDINSNVKNNNNVAWKNVSVVSGQNKKSSNKKDGLIVNNIANQNTSVRLSFSVPVAERSNSFLNQGTVVIDLGKTVYDKWVAGGKQGSGVETCQGGTGVVLMKTTANIANIPRSPCTLGANEIRVVSNDAYIDNLDFNANEIQRIGVLFDYTPQPAGVPQGIFNYDIIQSSVTNGVEKRIGGVRYHIGPPNCSLVATITGTTDVSCNGGNDGSINLTVTGGKTPYSYSWSNGATSEDLNNIMADTYSVAVTDAAGCPAEITAVITEPQPLTTSVTTSAVLCNGGNNGSVDLTVTGGTAPYTYLWSNGETTEDLSNLTAGTYTVTITDANNCTKTEAITITEPQQLSATAFSTDVTCKGGSNGSVDLTVTGGTSPYSYLWSNGATTEDINNLFFGIYSITVTDANQCTTKTTKFILEPTSITATATSISVTCSGNNDGSIDLTVLGGTSPYSYNWSNGATTEDLNNLTAGTYSLTITDGNGCTAMVDENITATDAIQLTLSTTNPGCSNNGAIDLTVIGGAAPYLYTWSNGATTEDLSNLSPDTYTITVTDANGCIATSTATLTGGVISTYSVSSIPYTPDSYHGGTVVPLGDDAVSGSLPIGFSFCFFENTYTQFYIGSNGWISFSAGQTTAYRTVPIPDATNKSPKNAIMLPWQDLYSSGGKINYALYGTAPYRKLVVSYDSIIIPCSYAHGFRYYQGQVVLNETSNIIENYIRVHDNTCNSMWGIGPLYGVQGIQNLTGTVAVVVPGRNKAQWVSVNEGWRYTPESGTSQKMSDADNLQNGQSITIDSQESKVVYYPNPATHELVVMIDGETTDSNYELVLTNVIGQKVTSKYFTGKTTLDVSGIRPKGLYFIQILKEDGTPISTGKLVLEE